MRTNRSLDLLGVPDLPERAFIKEGGQIKPQGGSGGGGGQPTQQTVTQTNIPEYARPYAESLMGRAEALTTSQPFTPYTDQRFAEFDPMQAQAFQQIAGQQIAPQLTDASGIALSAAQQGLGTQPMAAGLQQQALQYGGLGAQYGALGAMTAPQAQRYGAAAAGIGSLGAQQAEQGFGAGAQYAQQATSPEAMQAYMSPYMQNVVDRQQQEAIRQSNIARQTEQARAVGQGAFGGSRSAIVEAEMQRGLGDRLADIQAQGLQRAFEQAQQAQQFGAGLGLQGLQTGFQGLQTGIAGQQAGMQGIQTGLQGTAQGMQGAGMGLQGVGQATGAGQLGLAGGQLGIQGAGALGALGGTQFDQQMAIADAQQKFGALQQQQAQQQLDFDYQQFLARQQHPYQQLSFMSDILRGVPSAQSAQFTTAPQPALAPQLIGAGLGAYGAFARKEGGRVHKYREGGQVKGYQEGGNVSPMAMQTMAVQEMPSKLRRLSDSQLAAYARTVRDAISLSAIQTELERRARARMPGGEPPEVTTAEGIAQRAEAAGIGQPRVGMAGGGIVALQAGGSTNSIASRIHNFLFPPPAGSAPSDEELQQRMGIVNPYATQQPSPSAPTTPPASPAPSPLGNWSALAAPLRGGTSDSGSEVIGTYIAPTSPSGATTPQEPEMTSSGEDEMFESMVDPRGRQEEQRGQTQVGGPASQTGIAAAGRPRMPSTFEQFREMARQVEPNPEDQAVLADMRRRVEERMTRAEEQGDTAKYDAILMAGLAMMGGTSLADGIARAAQQGGATYMASRQEARKALDAAENAELAFNQYQIELRKGDEKAARDEFKNYTDYVLKLQEIDATYARTAAMAADTQANRALGRISQLEGAIGRAKREVEDQPKYKIPLTELRKKMEGGTITPQEEARYQSIIAAIDTEVAERTRNLRNQLDSVYDSLAGTGSIDGFTVRRPQNQ